MEIKPNTSGSAQPNPSETGVTSPAVAPLEPVEQKAAAAKGVIVPADVIGASATPAPEPAPEAAPVDKPAPWLITAWPGMGNVAMITAGYLVEKLGAQPIAELSSAVHFDVDKVDVRDGVVASTQMPRNVFYRWVNPKGRDLLIFVGEAQPSVNTYAFAHALLEHASKLGIERVITVASMASQLHPSAEPRVFGVATDKVSLEELRQLEVKPLEDGQIGGLNGVMLGVAAERGVPGVCLLGEIPYFAAGVPNPKGAKAVLETLAVLAGIEIDFTRIAKHAKRMDKVILELLKRLQEHQAGEDGQGVGEFGDDEESSIGNGAGEDEDPAQESAPPKAEPKSPDFATRSRIEEMFEEARKDRGRAVRLKDDLEKLGVFKLYENRFLDLFKRAG